MTERNIPLLQETMQQILDHPELHIQGWWFTKLHCGTAACFAGWACLLSGEQAVFEGYGSHRADRLANGAWAQTWATELLGLTTKETSKLFYSSNPRSVLELMVKDLVNGDEMGTMKFYYEEAGEWTPSCLSQDFPNE